jgi:hypothetical protein
VNGTVLKTVQIVNSFLHGFEALSYIKSNIYIYFFLSEREIVAICRKTEPY